MCSIGNYKEHARFWDWGGLDHDRTPEDAYWYAYAKRYGNRVLSPMCALGEAGAYMARRGMEVTAFDRTPEMIQEGKKRFGDLPGLTLLEGDVTNFSFNIPPVDFCFSMDFGHLLTIADVKKALICINRHLREGGGFVLETSLPGAVSYSTPLQTFKLVHQPYPGLKVWKTGESRFDGKTGRMYITQTFYAADEQGKTERFDHTFCLQEYPRAQWLAAFCETGFKLAGEYTKRETESWQSGGDGFCIFEVKKEEK